MNKTRTHTWEKPLEYLKCPHCHYINENRDLYEDHHGKLEKEVTCERCQKIFIQTQKSIPKFGPLLGKPQPIEAEWREPQK